jgi:hypothetical protein
MSFVICSLTSIVSLSWLPLWTFNTWLAVRMTPVTPSIVRNWSSIFLHASGLMQFLRRSLRLGTWFISQAEVSNGMP